MFLVRACQIGTFSPQFGLAPFVPIWLGGRHKANVDVEALKDLRPLNQLTAEHGIQPNQIGQWRTQVLAAQHYV